MPNLPTLTVTQAQADRILAVFGDVATYKAWLKGVLIDKVISTESSARAAAYQADAQAAIDATKADLGTAT